MMPLRIIIHHLMIKNSSIRDMILISNEKNSTLFRFGQGAILSYVAIFSYSNVRKESSGFHLLADYLHKFMYGFSNCSVRSLRASIFFWSAWTFCFLKGSGVTAGERRESLFLLGY